MSLEMKQHTNSSSATIFDEGNPEYQCCCGTMHVKMGSSLIAMFAMFGLGVNFAYRMSVDNSTISGVLPLVVGTLAVIALMIGLKIRVQQLLIPFLVIQALGIAAVFALLILCFISLFFGQGASEVVTEESVSTTASTQLPHNDSTNASVTIGMLLGELILQLWFMNTVWRCYCYFSVLKQHRAALGVSNDV